MQSCRGVKKVKNKENEIAREIVDAAVSIHIELGPGLLESAYEKVLKYELTKRGFNVEAQVSISIHYDNEIIDDAFRADLIINGLVIVELKSIERIMDIHKKQLLTYLKLSNKKLGLLLNFGAPLMKQGIVRIANGVSES